MRYFANPAGAIVREAMIAGVIDCIVTPGQGRHPDGVTMCADNGCFGKRYVGDEAWWRWLQDLDLDLVQFAVAPDVVGDAEATLERSRPWLERIRSLGVDAALVAQNGLEEITIPWDEFDVLFIGGDTDWKLGPAAAGIAREASDRGKWVHMGRVNSQRRMIYASAIGCDSADGTFLTFGPDKNLPRLLAMLDAARTPRLWEES